MNIEEKTKLAHEWYIKHSESASFIHTEVESAWEYADEMEKQAEQRIKQKVIEDAKESRELMDSLTRDKQSNCNHIHTTLNRAECFDCGAILNHSNPQELKPEVDWSQAPENSNIVAWDINSNGQARWITEDGGYYFAPSFNYQGDWKQSLRNRPQ